MTRAQLGAAIAGVISIAAVLALIGAHRRLGTLNAASWLVVFGAAVSLMEHPQFSITCTVPFEAILDEGTLEFLPHARIHFFMSGYYTVIGLVLLCVIAPILLRELPGWLVRSPRRCGLGRGCSSW